MKNHQLTSKRLRNKRTPAERVLWKSLVKIPQGDFIPQYRIGPYTTDFYSPSLKMVVEVDGEQHYTPRGLHHDDVRKEHLNSLGIKTLRFTNGQVLNDLDGVISAILEEFKKGSICSEGG